MVQEYLREMDIPDVFYERLLKTPSNSIYRLSGQEALSLVVPPSIEEWFIARCGGSIVDTVEPEREEVLSCWYKEIALASEGKAREFRARN